uniref:Uncharacterized protein n=1 Tax=Ascaris lumbricoides TaxID=6252 RepID=A0A0M3HV96_ASCLU
MHRCETNMLAGALLTEIRFVHKRNFSLASQRLPIARSASLTLSYGPFVRDILHVKERSDEAVTPRSGNCQEHTTKNRSSAKAPSRIGEAMSPQPRSRAKRYETQPENIRENSIVLDMSSVFMSSLIKAIESKQFNGGFLTI